MAQALLYMIYESRGIATNANVPMNFLGIKLRYIPQIAKRLETIVQNQVDASGINDAHGKIKRWQQVRVGSKYGYAAVSAVKGETGANSPGAITNYLESGHKVPYPSGKSARYRPEVHCAKARAYGFYKSSEALADKLSAEYAKQFEKDVANMIERQAAADMGLELEGSDMRGA